METNIQDIEFIKSRNLTVDERPADDDNLGGRMLVSISIFIIVVTILIVVLYSRFKRKKINQENLDKSINMTDNSDENKNESIDTDSK